MENSPSAKTLRIIHSKLASELNEVLSERAVSFAIGAGIWKFLAAMIPWVVLSLYFIRGIRKNEKNSVAALAASIFLGIVFGAIGLVIPALLWPWLNLVIYPLGHFLLFFGLLSVSRVRQGAQSG